MGYHLFRAGCNIRYIQEILGHKLFRNTEIYTKVDSEDLRSVLDNCHPRTMGDGPDDEKTNGRVKCEIILLVWLPKPDTSESTIRGKLVCAKHFFEYVARKETDFRDIGADLIRRIPQTIGNAKVSAKNGKATCSQHEEPDLSRCEAHLQMPLPQRAHHQESGSRDRVRGERIQGAEDDFERAGNGAVSRRNRHWKGRRLRERTIFELMYSSGLRVSEVAGLMIGDIDFEEPAHPDQAIEMG